MKMLHAIIRLNNKQNEGSLSVSENIVKMNNSDIVYQRDAIELLSKPEIKVENIMVGKKSYTLDGFIKFLKDEKNKLDCIWIKPAYEDKLENKRTAESRIVKKLNDYVTFEESYDLCNMMDCEELAGSKNPSAQDKKVPAHFKSFIKPDNHSNGCFARLCGEIPELIDLVKPHVLFSWGESGGMLPFGDANCPEDISTPIHYFGSDYEPSIEFSVEELVEKFNFSEKEKKLMTEMLNFEQHSRRTLSVSKFDGKSGYFYGRAAYMACIYIHNKELKKILNGLAKKNKYTEVISRYLDSDGDLRAA